MRADYYRDAQAMARREEENTRTLAADTLALDEAKANRQDAADKRQLEQDAKAGRITDEGRRNGEAAILERQRKRLNDDATQKNKEADEAKQKGDADKAARLQLEAVELRARADAVAGQQYDLLHPDEQQGRRAAVVDSLQRVGGGGGVFYGPGKEVTAAQADRQIKLLEQIDTKLEKANDRRVGSAFQ